MRAQSHHGAGSPAAQTALQALAGWQPHHHSLTAAAAELADVQERDAAARNAFARSAAQ
jgi:hypothetical protein